MPQWEKDHWILTEGGPSPLGRMAHLIPPNIATLIHRVPWHSPLYKFFAHINTMVNPHVMLHMIYSPFFFLNFIWGISPCFLFLPLIRG